MGTASGFANLLSPARIPPGPMKKAEKIQELLGALAETGPAALDPCYTGYFQCFNAQRYYEAHDVLEHLWLQTRDGNHAFYKGLIQLAGGFVHLQKQYLRPDHPKDGRRTRPAARLFGIAARNLAPFRPLHLHLDVDLAWQLCTRTAAEIVRQDFRVNPWSPAHAPHLSLHP